jgi:hypothetical protein
MAYELLVKSIKNDNKYTELKAFFCDFETIIIEGKHFPICYSIYKKNKFSKKESLDFGDKINFQVNSKELILNFLTDCFNVSTEKVNRFYFHNLGRFDSYFIINVVSEEENLNLSLISRNRINYQVSIYNKNLKKTIHFIDSYLLLNMSLDSISNIFCKNFKKMDFNHKYTIEDYFNNKEYINRLETFCLNDSKTLSEGFLNFRHYIWDHFNILCEKNLTLPSLALRVFRSKYYNEVQNPIVSPTPIIDEILRKGYFGGSVELYKPQLLNGFYYDVNSLYPFVMKTMDMPVGEGKFILIDREKNFKIETFFGFLEIELYLEEGLLDKPILLIQDHNLGLIAPFGSIRGVYFSEEIKYALKLGYTIKRVFTAIEFKRGNPFVQFIDELYRIRLNTPKNSALNTTVKTMMNASYGRWGMSSKKTKIGFANTKEEIAPNFENIYAVSSILKIGSKFMIQYTDEIDIKELENMLKLGEIDRTLFNKHNSRSFKNMSNSTSAVHIASSITSYARMYMHEFKNDPKLDVYYSDTDSIFCQNKIDDKFVSNTELGKFKLVDSVKRALFITGKCYAYINNEDHLEKRSKGVNSDKLSFEDFEKLYRGESHTLERYRAFIRNNTNFTITEKKSSFKISGDLLKRNKVYSFKGEWINTKPKKV